MVVFWNSQYYLYFGRSLSTFSALVKVQDVHIRVPKLKERRASVWDNPREDQQKESDLRKVQLETKSCGRYSGMSPSACVAR